MAVPPGSGGGKGLTEMVAGRWALRRAWARPRWNPEQPTLWSRAGGQCVVLADGIAHQLAACSRRKTRVSLDLFDPIGDLVILDPVADPTRIVARPQMKEPRLVVDSVRELKEDLQVLGS